MRDRRWMIITALAVVELWIVGLMIRSVAGHGARAASAASPSTFNRVVQAAGSAFAHAFDTGPAPHVVVDDSSALLTVNVRAGNQVTVAQQIRAHGWTHVSEHIATVERTADGVEIDEPPGIMMFGSFERRIEIVVPPGTRLDVKHAGAIAVAGLRREATLSSDAGTISVSDHVGDLSVKTENGRVELVDVQGSSIDVGSDDGRIICNRLRSPDLTLKTDNGSIDVSSSVVGGGNIRTDNGRIRLGLDPQSNVTVSARVEDGKVHAQPPLVALPGGNDGDAPSLVRVGNGEGRLDVGSDNGSISVQIGGV